jgi:ClpX C4-type zinc finger
VVNERSFNSLCSFCRKDRSEVGLLVEGPGDVYICGLCAELCQKILKREDKRRRGWSPWEELKLDLNSGVQHIHSREKLAEFVLVLLHDLRTRPDDWEHRDLESYLDALAAWVGSMDGYYQNCGEPVPTQPTWKTLGEILLAAKVYE